MIAQDRRVAFLLACFLFACYLLTYTGVLESSDGLSMFATTESIARRGEADANQLLWMGLQQGSFGPDGDLYSRKGVGMTLLAWPLVWLAVQWSARGWSMRPCCSTRCSQPGPAALSMPPRCAWAGAALSPPSWR